MPLSTYRHFDITVVTERKSTTTQSSIIRYTPCAIERLSDALRTFAKSNSAIPIFQKGPTLNFKRDKGIWKGASTKKSPGRCCVRPGLPEGDTHGHMNKHSHLKAFPQGHFKTGHSHFQIRPLGSETGQYPKSAREGTANVNDLRTPIPSPNREVRKLVQKIQ